MKTVIALSSNACAGLLEGNKAMVPVDRDDFSHAAAGLPHGYRVLNTDRDRKGDAGSVAVSS